jgi:hypothetical protein
MNKDEWFALKWMFFILCLLTIPYAVGSAAQGAPVWILNLYGYIGLSLLIVTITCTIINNWLEKEEKE